MLDDYHLFCQGKLNNPFPLYHHLRADDPVHWSEQADSWILTRYDDVKFALQYDPRITAERLSLLINKLPTKVRGEVEPLRQLLSKWMQQYDPPEHTRLRKLVSKTFTARMLERLRGRIRVIVDELIDHVQENGEMEFIRDFAYPVPAIVIAEMLGVPPEHRDQFKQWSADLAAFLEGVGTHWVDATIRANQSALELTKYLGELFSLRRQSPQEDLISQLVAVEEQGDRLSEDELYGMCSFILEAGHETTTGLLANGLLALIQHPDQLQQLRENPSLIDTAVEEMLRYDSSIQRISRMAIQDFMLDGKPIKQGQRLWAMIGAANRDPAQFPEPDRFDIGRQNNKHVAFGFGTHHCVGAPLARLEAQIGFTTLLERLPDLSLATDNVEWCEGISLRVPEVLPVTFTSTSER